MTVVADTGALYALIDASDAWHARVLAWWRSQSSGVVVPVSVLPEVCYLLQTRIGPAAELAFVQAVAEGEFTTEPIEQEDVARAAALMHKYIDLPLGFVDASVVAVAERLETREILTTDRRHFSVVRARHTRSLTLLP
ncbi:MAG: PIN domain-containing protein [bacterium]